MKKKIEEYIESFFANADKTEQNEEFKQEIILNSLEKYDDLVASGMSEGESYSKVVVGIGNLYEVINFSDNSKKKPKNDVKETKEKETQPKINKNTYSPKANRQRTAMLAVAISLYIMCVVPVIICSALGGENMELLGVSLMFLMIAAATGIIIFRSTIEPRCDEKREKADEKYKEDKKGKKSPVCKKICSVIRIVNLIVYLAISFATMQWYLTWMLFLVCECVIGIVNTVFEIKDGE